MGIRLKRAPDTYSGDRPVPGGQGRRGHLTEDRDLISDDPGSSRAGVRARSGCRWLDGAGGPGLAARAPDDPRPGQHRRLGPDAQGVRQLAARRGARGSGRVPWASKAAGASQAHRATPGRYASALARPRFGPRPGPRAPPPRHRPAGIGGGRDPSWRPATRQALSAESTRSNRRTARVPAARNPSGSTNVRR
jgi:hypothetical protein